MKTNLNVYLEKAFVFFRRYIGLAVVVLIGLSYLDGLRYISAVKDVYLSEGFATQLAAQSKAISDDIQGYSNCARLRQESPSTHKLELTDEVRQCLMIAMPKTKTRVGAVAYTTLASSWLLTHPDDNDLRAAALIAIEHGRASLANEKKWYYDRIDQIGIAHNRSILMRTWYGHQEIGELFESDVKILNESELRIMLPDVMRKQDAWLFTVIKESA